MHDVTQQFPSACPVCHVQVTYDKLETTNVYSKRFGKCRDNEIKLHHDGQDSTLFLGKDAGNYKVGGSETAVWGKEHYGLSKNVMFNMFE